MKEDFCGCDGTCVHSIREGGEARSLLLAMLVPQVLLHWSVSLEFQANLQIAKYFIPSYPYVISAYSCMYL